MRFALFGTDPKKIHERSERILCLQKHRVTLLLENLAGAHSLDVHELSVAILNIINVRCNCFSDDKLVRHDTRKIEKVAHIYYLPGDITLYVGSCSPHFVQAQQKIQRRCGVRTAGILAGLRQASTRSEASPRFEIMSPQQLCSGRP